MSKTNKILFAFFVVLLLITIGEIVYFVTTRSLSKTAVKPSIKTTPTATATIAIPNPQELTTLARERNVNRFIQDLEKGYITDSILVAIYQGTFLGYELLSTDQNKIYNGGLKVSIELNITQNDKINNLVIPAKTVSIMKVYERTNNTDKEIKISDIKKGDTVIIKQEYDIMEADPSKGMTAFMITKVN